MAEFEAARVELEQEREELRQNLQFKRSQAQTRSRRRAGSRDQGRVEALGAAVDLARVSNGCAISSTNCSQRRDELTRQLADGEAPLQALATSSG